MKIGLIADIHGNLQALTAVLHELYAQGVDLILCAGDLVCYGAHPNHVITMLRQCAIPCVTGNYDAAVAWNLPSAARKPSSPLTEPLKQAALAWTKEQIQSQHRDYLRGLPWSMNFQIDGRRIHLLHAGPNYLDEWLTPEQPDELANLAKSLNDGVRAVDMVVLGHTHQAYIYRTGILKGTPDRSSELDEGIAGAPIGLRTLFINPGSVGRSLDGDTRAAYALFDTKSGDAQLCRIDYDLDIAVQAIQRSGMPAEVALLVRQGARRLEQLPPALLAQYGIETL